MINRLFATFVLALAASTGVKSANRIEINGTFDGTDLITISQQNAHWNHLFGDLNISGVSINGVQWNPSVIYDLPNSGATTFLTNKVNFASARLTLLGGGRDTVVLNRSRDYITLSIADTPSGPGNYHFIIDFPDVPTLEVNADIDGSDELHISFAGARWIHKQWSWPTGVSLNGVAWNPVSMPSLTNAGATAFLPQPVRFANAVLVENSARDILTLRASEDGIILNFADNYLGADHYHALIAFPPDDVTNNAAIAVVSSAEISIGDAAGLNIATQPGVWYELEVTSSLQPATWQSTGAFIRGNGNVMTLFDPSQPDGTHFYRIVSRPRPN
ncbi:MAG TPA: hypothetical protein VI282_09820 [Verrucomicrobiae bacterium]|jgi:hypothetical protein